MELGHNGIYYMGVDIGGKVYGTGGARALPIRRRPSASER